MTSPVILVTSALLGGAIGIFYFGGLRLTIARGLVSRRPQLWFLSSFLIRTVLTVAGVWWATGGEPFRLLACMAGFTAARAWMIGQTEPKRGAPDENQP